MRISHNTPDMLIVEDRPIVMALIFGSFILFFLFIGINMLFAGALFGVLFLLFAGIGLLMAHLFVRRSQVVFHRPENWLEIRSRSTRGSNTIRHRLDEVEKATLTTSYSSDKNTYRVELFFPAGESAGNHPITHYLSSSEKHAIVADAINAWLDSGPPRA